jgi:hypothetical protein
LLHSPQNIFYFPSYLFIGHLVVLIVCCLISTYF